MPPIGSYDVVVVGAGVIGASVAWHACRAGLRVAVLDAVGPSAGASGASDGAVSVATKKPGVLAALAGQSLNYCSELADGDKVLAGVFNLRPSFLFSSSEKESDALDRMTDMLADPAIPVAVFRDGQTKDSAIADMGAGVDRVIELRGEGHMLGYRLVAALLSDCDAKALWPHNLLNFEAGRNGVVLQTSAGEVRTTRLVLAAGQGIGALLPAMPFLSRSGQLIVTDRCNGPGGQHLPGALTSAAYLLDKEERNTASRQAPVVIDPLDTGQFLIGSSREDGGTSRQTDFRTIRRLLASGVACLPALAQRRIIRVFAGVRSACADGYPVVGPVPGAPGVSVAAGFEGDGICLAPLIGREMSKMLLGVRPISEIDALSPARFSMTRVAV